MKMTKIKPIQALAKIKILINKHFEDIGREELDDLSQTRQELIDDIDEIIRNTKIPTKILILERFNIDKSEEYNLQNEET